MSLKTTGAARDSTSGQTGDVPAQKMTGPFVWWLPELPFQRVPAALGWFSSRRLASDWWFLHRYCGDKQIGQRLAALVSPINGWIGLG